jgi:uncharacterized protein involved in exopolysaccharide biosynthesis
VRFGAPEAIAAQVVAKRHRLINQCLVFLAGVRRATYGSRGTEMTTQRNDSFAGALGTVWRRKWWILVPTALSALVTSVVSYYFLPTRYQSEASLLVVPRRISEGYVRSTVAGNLGDRLQQINDQIMSRTRLEKIIADFNLYEQERRTASIDDVISQMRKDIKVNILTSHDAQGNDGRVFRVSFVSSNPRTALKVTDRLASLFIEMNLRDKEMQAEGTITFIDEQIVDVRRQIISYEKMLETLRAQDKGHPLSQADLLPYEVLQETYRALLTKSQESRIAANLERRQSGEQLKIVDPARLPERPVGPRRSDVNVIGGLAGLVLALAFVGHSSFRQPRPER